MSYIEVNHLKKTYGDLSVLDDINFSVNKGEMIAVIGKSGSGKSTLLHIMAGLENMDSGEYFLDEKEISKMKDKKVSKIRNQEIGYVMQDFGLIRSLTAYENIIVPIQIRKFWGNVDADNVKINEIANDLDIANILDKKVNLLSGGEQQRVAIARALIKNPKIILADEPTGFLDYENGNHIMELFEELKAKKHTIIIVTHDLNIARKCDRILMLREGVLQNTEDTL